MLVKNGWLYPPTKIYIARSQVHGLGVFANEDIHKGDIIEITPLIDVKTDPKDSCEVLSDYRFSYYVGREITKLVMALGYGSLYNHSKTPSADWRLNKELDMFEFYTIRDIKQHEEIYISYGKDDYWEIRPHIKVK